MTKTIHNQNTLLKLGDMIFVKERKLYCIIIGIEKSFRQLNDTYTCCWLNSDKHIYNNHNQGQQFFTYKHELKKKYEII